MTAYWQVYELKGRTYYIERDGTQFHRYDSRPKVCKALKAQRGRQQGMLPGHGACASTFYDTAEPAMPAESQGQSTNGSSKAVSAKATTPPLSWALASINTASINAAVQLCCEEERHGHGVPPCTAGGMPELVAAAAAPEFATPPESPYASSSDGGRAPESEGSVQQLASPGPQGAGAALALDSSHSLPSAQRAAAHAAAQGPWLAARAPAGAARAQPEGPGAAGGVAQAATHRFLLPYPSAAPAMQLHGQARRLTGSSPRKPQGGAAALRTDATTATELARLAAAKEAAIAA